QGLEIALPGKQVQPGETWKAHRPLPVDDVWKLLGVLPTPMWTALDSDSLEVTFTYAGLRTVNGVEQAVISLKGQAVQQAGRPARRGRLASRHRRRGSGHGAGRGGRSDDAGEPLADDAQRDGHQGARRPGRPPAAGISLGNTRSWRVGFSMTLVWRRQL